MNLNDWNPLPYFKEIKSTVPKLLFILGFVFLAVAIPRGISPYNKTFFVALVVFALALTTHYFSQWSYPVRINGRISIKWTSLVKGTAMLMVTAAFLWWLWVISGRPIILR